MDKIEIDAVVIGGGIIGIMTALELKLQKPQWEIALLEQAQYLGDHSTGRNSGVLHASLYYPTNSLKHRLCLEGIEIWKKDLSPKYGIEYNQCGKVVFASDLSEESGLEELWSQANKNEASGLRWPNSIELSGINQFVTATKAFMSTGTGILDVTGAIKNLSDKFVSLGGMISKNCKADSLTKISSGYIVGTNEYEIHSNVVVNAAGFFAPDLRKKLDLNDIDSYLVKGNYISTSQKLDHPHLFYPVPPKDLKGLGVHSTLDMQGKVKFGPNTEDVSTIDYSDSQIALNAMKPAILNKFKGVKEELLYWDYAGIRSKIINAETKKLIPDFIIQSPMNGYIECLGIESPGLTSAPAIARMIFKKFIA